MYVSLWPCPTLQNTAVCANENEIIYFILGYMCDDDVFLAARALRTAVVVARPLREDSTRGGLPIKTVPI